ncbi:hypothetical protein TNIN_91271 [Trichonephila inaurata madagascariensis]|uniref:Uncharacterized protein n=1 Tax=Trichonephila inaurata madagascariensis TaxID=2747483 RepID=A0A8X6WSB2_9ARAC|nr:hypothetical protein TNIN_91271 [Trichonephila inaurata madagascariensis]
MESFSQPFVAGCLRSAENSAPGQDLICYKHWRELDPSCSVLTRIFNICIKLSDVPAAWKASRTVLIHKKGDVNNLEKSNARVDGRANPSYTAASVGEAGGAPGGILFNLSIDKGSPDNPGEQGTQKEPSWRWPTDMCWRQTMPKIFGR